MLKKLFLQYWFEHKQLADVRGDMYNVKMDIITYSNLKPEFTEEFAENIKKDLQIHKDIEALRYVAMQQHRTYCKNKYEEVCYQIKAI